MTNAELLLSIFSKYGDQTAIIYNDRKYSYSWLIERIEYWRKKLLADSIINNVVGFYGDYSPNTISLFFSLVLTGNVLVPLSTSCKEEQEKFIDIADIRYLVFFQNEDQWIVKVLNTQLNNNLLKEFFKLKKSGIVLFSSGSTGTPKGILHHSDKLLYNCLKKKKKFTTITFLALDHIGGINTLLYQLSGGGTIVTAEDRSTGNICNLIEKYKVDLLPVTPSFINLLLLSEDFKKYNLSSLKIITYGTEVMPDSTLKKLAATFPEVMIKQTYGLSEIGILPSKSEGSESRWVKLGRDGYQIKVVDNILWINTDLSMIGYLNADSPFDKEGWFNTGDMVEVKGDYFRILGRKSEIINVGGLKVFPQEIEDCIIQMPEIEDVTVSGEHNGILGNIIVASVKLADKLLDASELRRRIQMYCKDKLQRYKIPAKVYINDEQHFNHRFKKIRYKESDAR